MQQQQQPMCLYLLGHNGPSVPTTHINASDDPFKALAEHNAGKHRETKNAAGSWQLMLLIYIPPERGIDVAHLVQHWRDQRRTLDHRLTYGIGMAAKLMLLCFVNGEQLRAAKCNDKHSQRLLQKVLAKLEGSHATQINHDTVRQRVERYLQSPRHVYEARNGPTSSAAGGGDWLKKLNTLKRRQSDTVCFSHPLNAVEHTMTTTTTTNNDDDDDDGDTHHEEEPVAQATANVKRAKKSMTVVNGLVSLQQSAAFNDAALAPTAQTLITNNTPAPSTGTARRRQRNSLFNSHGTVDARTLSLYGDALCVDMSSHNTLANMRVVGGENDRRCVCGAPRLSDDELVSVVLTPDGEPVAAHRCNSCDRLSATYERYCIDSSRADRTLKGKPEPRTSADDVSASNDSLDVFVQTLLVSFNDSLPLTTTTTSAPVARARTPKKPADGARARKRLFGVTPDEVHESLSIAQSDNTAEESLFVFGNRSVKCKHASLTEVQLTNTDTDVIGEMIKVG